MTVEVSPTCDHCGAELARFSLPDGVTMETVNAAIRARVPTDTKCPKCGWTVDPPEDAEVVEIPDAPP